MTEPTSHWHRLIEAIVEQRILISTCHGDQSADSRHKTVNASRVMHLFNMGRFLKEMIEYDLTVPKIVVSGEVWDLANQEQAAIDKNIQHLQAMGHDKLPYQTMVVEFMNGPVPVFVLLRQWSLDMQPTEQADASQYPYRACMLSLIWSKETNKWFAMVDPSITAAKFALNPTNGEFEFFYANGNVLWLKDDPEVVRWITNTHNYATTVASKILSIVLLMMRTRGVAKTEVAAPEKLNKNRAANKKPLMRAYTYVHVGHVFDKAGNEIKINRRQGANPDRKPTIMHWRRGHSKTIMVGKGRTIAKQIWIDATLVNFDENDPKTKPPKIMMKV